ncbi:Wadjet anti-phage system protein JetD domain-containing protein [Terrilactibacillus laevilacticus]|uniref:Wadjet anti-phage system protein JetD domain-containing protein n=1 Tax=Terrilactibacillus laevilacticus TaxID=1380157 RepID=UPI001146FDE6|nr:Wadjet anti-phage system protein JetD domain-containing protein [Terrilactibacillus laevilacticus]
MDQIRKIFTTFKKKTITLLELEHLLNPFFPTYEAFSETILQFEEREILVMVKAKGRTDRSPSLAFQYRINKSLLMRDFHKELQIYRGKLHPSINIDEYYRMDPSIWKKHLPFILKVDQFIKQNSFPTEYVPAPERSYELVGDEKWIIEKGGKEILERIGLFHLLNIIPVSEPLMFAINPKKINARKQYHLIVENKTTYQGLLQILRETKFSTLIYGRGKAIIKSIEQFSIQYPVVAHHDFFYFGDLDKEGIWIWHALNNKQPVRLAMPFYFACLKKEPAVGKAYQREHGDSMKAFLLKFPLVEQEVIRNMLASGKYWPQETLKTRELQQVWRESDWTSLIYKK